MDHPPSAPAPTGGWSADLPTIMGIAVVAYLLATLLHEGLGHGGACVVAGGVPQVLSSVHFDCDEHGLGRAGSRLVAAGGTVVNLLAGLVCLAVLRGLRGAGPALRYFIWLLMTINLFQGAGYFLFSGVGGLGDWAAIIQGLGHAWAYRTGMALFGAVLYGLFVWLAFRELGPLIGGDAERWRRAARLAVVPYLTGGVAECLAGLFNPVGMILVAISAAAASLGGTSGLAWGHNWLRGGFIPRAPGPARSIPRSWGWIGAGAAALLVLVLVLGPGVRLSR